MAPSLKSRFQYVSDICGAHGLAYATHKATPWSDRVLWLLISIGSLLLCIHYSTRCVSQYREYNVASKIATETTSSVPLPSITICNNNEARYRAYTYDDIVKFASDHFGINDISSFVANPEEVKDSDGILQHVLEVLTTRLGEGNVTEEEDYLAFVRRVGHQRDGIIKECKTIDRNHGQHDECTETISTTNVYPYGNCYTINGNGTMYTSTTGISLYVSLDYELSQYNLARNEQNQPAMFFIQIHPPGQAPDYINDKVIFYDGLPLSVVVRRVTYVSELPAPYSECIPSELGSQYSHQGCLRDCAAARVYHRLSCVLYDMITTAAVRYPVCDGLRGINERAFNITWEVMPQCRQTCQHPCNRVEFDYDISKGGDTLQGRVYDYKVNRTSRTTGDRKSTQNVLRPGTSPDDSLLFNYKDMLGIYLYNDMLEVQHHDQLIIYTIDQLIADVGGIVCACIGLSLFTLMHFSQLLVSDILHRCVRKINTSVQPAAPAATSDKQRALFSLEDTLRKTITTLYIRAMESPQYDEPQPQILRPDDHMERFHGNDSSSQGVGTRGGGGERPLAMGTLKQTRVSRGDANRGVNKSKKEKPVQQAKTERRAVAFDIDM